MKKVKKYKISRRLGIPLFEKCQTQKFALREAKRKQSRFSRESEYSKQLKEKQKLRYLYNLNEKTLKNYVKKALKKAEKGKHEQELINLLESRLDSVAYVLGLANTRRMARQLVSHGHATVNGKRVTIPSMHIKETDVVGVREKSRKNSLFIDTSKKITPISNSAKWDPKKMEGKIIGAPNFDESLIDLSTVFEYYSR